MQNCTTLFALPCRTHKRLTRGCYGVLPFAIFLHWGISVWPRGLLLKVPLQKWELASAARVQLFLTTQTHGRHSALAGGDGT